MRLFGGRRTATTPEPASSTMAPADPGLPPGHHADIVRVYADDCMLTGRLVFPGPRLTDALARLAELALTSVHVEALDDGRLLELEDLALDVDDICAITAPAPAGDPARKVRTLSEPVLAEVGPYTVVGVMHAPPSAQPTATMQWRTFKPVTAARIAIATPTGVIERHHDVLLVNRRHASRVTTIVDVGLPLESLVRPWPPRA